MILAGFLALSIGFSSDPFTRYVFEHDATTRWTQSPTKGTPKSINLVSQTWHGVKWKHDVTINQPAKLINMGTAVLVITGDRTGLNDEAFATNLAGIAGMPVATLYQIPNQPIWDQKEDGLIALTLQKWFETKDDSWPLLFPMAKSAYEAMNAIEKSTAKTKNPIKKFVVTGASKRGWTTWLVAGTGDKRIIGIAPVVFDNLNIVAQMKHQKELWGHYSPQIQDYEKSGMLAALETPDGKRLAAMLDPLTYADRIKCPLFSINGTNDPFWAPDAMSLYWDKLKMPKSCLFLPNEGHTFETRGAVADSLGAFVASCAGEIIWPSLGTRILHDNGFVRGDYRFEGLRKDKNKPELPRFLYPAKYFDPGMYICDDILLLPSNGTWRESVRIVRTRKEVTYDRVEFISRNRIEYSSGAVILAVANVGRHRITLSSPPKVFHPK